MSNEYLFAHKHILGLDHLSVSDIEHILITAESFKEISGRSIKKVPVLRGKTVVTLFFEPSTRTRLSFDIAAKRMSADTFSISASTSSTTKGETLADTAKNIEAMMPDIIIMRHPSSGAAHYLAKHIKTSVINAGDGAGQHPTQALLDMYTIVDAFPEKKGLKIAMVGDLRYGRTVRSLSYLLTLMSIMGSGGRIKKVLCAVKSASSS